MKFLKIFSTHGWLNLQINHSCRGTTLVTAGCLGCYLSVTCKIRTLKANHLAWSHSSQHSPGDRMLVNSPQGPCHLPREMQQMNILVLKELITGNSASLIYGLTILIPSHLWLRLTWWFKKKKCKYFQKVIKLKWELTRRPRNEHNRIY